IDAAIIKIIRLTGGFRVISSDEKFQDRLDDFINNVPVGLTGKSLYTFIDNYLDSIITYGNAVGEIIINKNTGMIDGLYNGNICDIEIKCGNSPVERKYFLKNGRERILIRHPERILFTAMNPATDGMGRSILRGLPALSNILLRIYECIGQNYERIGNVRYAVTYKPSADSGERAYSKERAVQIAKEWADGMNSAKFGQVKDFVAVGDVDIKVIGAENQLFNTEIPVRQLLEQLISKLSIPPFLLGLNWSSTERMSSQQADILTSELEYYRRLLTPVICDIGNAFMRLSGNNSVCHVEWDNINLQDEKELAEARLKNAQALEIESRLNV
ncbi:MAG TPA: serine/threonine protein phosphatase, partial [Ruminococcus sp.]|nr:serine/threonine protein phosphatase [Ruminococcus sp.]